MKLIVLDFSDGNVNIIKDITNDINIVEEIVDSHFKASEVAWMLTEDDCRYFTWTYDQVKKDAVYDNENFIVND